MYIQYIVYKVTYFIKYIFSIILPILIGYVPVKLFFPSINIKSEYKKKSLSEIFFVLFCSFYAGFFIVSNIMIIFSLLGIPLELKNLLIIPAIFFAIALYFLLKDKLYKVNLKTDKNINNLQIIDKIVDSTEINFESASSSGSNSGSSSSSSSKKFITKNIKKSLPLYERYVILKRFKKSNIYKNIVFYILILFISLNFLIVVFFTFLFPIRFWDAISCWSLKGRAFFIDRDIISYFTQHNYEFSHLSYPLYLPLMQTWIYIWLGRADEILVKIIFPIFYLSCLSTLYYFFRQKLSRIISILLVFIFSSIPVVVNHGYIEYSNLLFAVVLMIAVYSLFLYRKSFLYKKYFQGFKTCLFSAFFFSLLPSIRSEGIFFLILFILLNTLFLFFDLKVKAGNKEKLKANPLHNFTMYCFSILIAGFSLLPWQLLKHNLGLPFLSTEWINLFNSFSPANSFRANVGSNIGSNIGNIISNINNTNIFSIFLNFNLKQALISFLKELFFSAYDSTKGYFFSAYGPLWVILFMLFFLNIRKSLKEGGWILFMFIFFGFLIIFISSGLIEDFTFSLDRYFLHLFPLTYLWIFSNL